jgi:endo-1,4-beta-xylanase
VRALILAALVACVLAAPAQAQTLKDVAGQTGIAVGAALPDAMRPDQRRDLALHFSAMTSENAFKWAAMQRKRAAPRFELTDRMVAWARRHHKRIRAHTLFWHRLQMPEWVAPLVARAGNPRRALRRLMLNRVRKVVGRYRGKIAIWDVVNEPLALAGAGWDDTNLFHSTLGERYIDLAFRAARRADPKAKLFLNELVWNPTAGDPKADALLRLVRRLKRRGVPLDGVGIQVHGMLGLEPPWFPESTESLAAYMRALAALGVEVELTELDIALPRLPPSPDPLAAQAEMYALVARACAQVTACTGLTVWGLRDRDSWLDDFPPTDTTAPNRPLLLDDDGRPKPAYAAVAAALLER